MTVVVAKEEQSQSNNNNSVNGSRYASRENTPTRQNSIKKNEQAIEAAVVVPTIARESSLTKNQQQNHQETIVKNVTEKISSPKSSNKKTITVVPLHPEDTSCSSCTTQTIEFTKSKLLKIDINNCTSIDNSNAGGGGDDGRSGNVASVSAVQPIVGNIKETNDRISGDCGEPVNEDSVVIALDSTSTVKKNSKKQQKANKKVLAKKERSICGVL